MKVCFAFITQNGLNNIWERYFEHSEDHHIILHTREPLINDINVTRIERHYQLFNDGWGKLVRLQLTLMLKAKQAGCDKLVFISESCIPVGPIEEFYSFLASIEGKTVVNYGEITWQTACVEELIPPLEVFTGGMRKNDTWVIIDKEHFDMYIDCPYAEQYYLLLRNEEGFYATIPALNGREHELINNCPITYADWIRSVNGCRNPHPFDTYNYYDYSLLQQLLENKTYFFARKFNPLLTQYDKLVRDYLFAC